MYQLTSTSSILRADGALIPADEGNADYLAYLNWVAEGNSAQPVPSPTTAELWKAYQSKAAIALAKADGTQLRIQEAVVLGLNSWTSPDVVAWTNYRRALRAIVGASVGVAGELPIKPSYPAGT